MTWAKVGNPFVRAILRSPLHGVLSGSLVLVTYTGRRSGRTFTIPVMYAEDGADLLAYVGGSATKVWWRNLKGSAPVRVRRRGLELDGTGSVITGTEQVRAAYVERFPRAEASLDADPAAVFVRITGLHPA